MMDGLMNSDVMLGLLVTLGFCLSGLLAIWIRTIDRRVNALESRPTVATPVGGQRV